jgi:hypothetical protein
MRNSPGPPCGRAPGGVDTLGIVNFTATRPRLHQSPLDPVSKPARRRTLPGGGSEFALPIVAARPDRCSPLGSLPTSSPPSPLSQSILPDPHSPDLERRRWAPRWLSEFPTSHAPHIPPAATLPIGWSSPTQAEPVQPVTPVLPFPPLPTLASLQPACLVMTLTVLPTKPAPKSCLAAAIVTRPTTGLGFALNPCRNSTLRLSRAIWAGADHWGQSR